MRATSSPCFITYFYPRPPRGGRRITHNAAVGGSQFLSTPSARRATNPLFRQVFPYFDFYPRPPRGGRLPVGLHDEAVGQFLSTPSARRATAVCDLRVVHLTISIHALREEGDTQMSPACPSISYFYPRPPRGGRRGSTMTDEKAIEFLSTPSARRATLFGVLSPALSRNFYPRPPRGGRQQKQRQNLYFQTNYTTFCTNLEEL